MPLDRRKRRSRDGDDSRACELEECHSEADVLGYISVISLDLILFFFFWLLKGKKKNPPF